MREELVKGMGTQFDPEYAKIMLHLIDLDIEYGMREIGEDDATATSIQCDRIYNECTIGIPVSEQITRIQFNSRPYDDENLEDGRKADDGRKAGDGFPLADSLPTLELFDALDGRVHEEEAKKKDLLYYEYGQIRVDGRTKLDRVRNVKVRTLPRDAGALKGLAKDSGKGLTKDTANVAAKDSGRGVANGLSKKSGRRGACYAVEAVRVKDHALIRITDDEKTVEYIIALPDSSRFLYISLTGEHCTISNIRREREAVSVAEDYIPRIAEEISYIKGRPKGDIPSVQIDGWRTQSTEGVPIKGNMQISFHTQSLPTARLVWHCPFVSIYSSKDGSVNGEGYREFLLLRLDGETWESDSHAENKVIIDHTRDFPGWKLHHS